MICPRCKFQNPDGVQYCQKCGFKLFHQQTIDGKICPNCGKLNALDQSRCSNCYYDLSNVQVQHQTTKLATKMTYHSKSLWVVVITLLITLGLFVGIGVTTNHGWEGQEDLPLRVRRYSADSRYLKTIYVAVAFENHAYHHSGNNYYFHGIIVSSRRKAENLSGHEIIRQYHAHPQKRVNIVSDNVANQSFTKIQYRYDSTTWFKLQPGKHYASKGYVRIHRKRYYDRIITEEAE